ncbi:MAG: lysophospholipid acyltransferase family protein [Muribaculaceae bacterium]|nr:lysophospholipid acyltransferase family protein [Muribaculaceae bacterium]
MMHSSKNQKGEEIFTFDQYPGIEVRPDVINFNDIVEMVPAAAKFPWLVKWLMHYFKMDEVNRMHSSYCNTPGPEFTQHLIFDDLNIKLEVDGMEILEQFKEGPFITVSNHPFGHIDGISLIYIVSRIRPEYKVMVNMILNRISAMRPNFIAVDQSQSDDPEKRKVSIAGVREALSMLRDGKPVGFFPAGAIGMTDKDGMIVDRPWQPIVLQIIQKAKVPVIPIYFHGKNSAFFNFLGHHCVPLRTANLVRELYKKKNKPMRVTIGQPISVEKQAEFGKDYEALGWYLRMQTYDLSGRHVTTLSK